MIGLAGCFFFFFFAKWHFTLTISSAAVHRRLGWAGGDVEEAIHEEGRLGQGGVVRPLIQSGEICKEGGDTVDEQGNGLFPMSVMLAVNQSDSSLKS